jgi:hypothetical protein
MDDSRGAEDEDDDEDGDEDEDDHARRSRTNNSSLCQNAWNPSKLSVIGDALLLVPFVPLVPLLLLLTSSRAMRARDHDVCHCLEIGRARR